jgi:autotransporter family porin
MLLGAGQALAVCTNFPGQLLVSGSETGPCYPNTSGSTSLWVDGGTISGGTEGVSLETNSSLTGGLTNTGTIAGTSLAIRIYNTGLLAGGLTNSGYIYGAASAISLDHGTLLGGLINNNTIAGNIDDGVVLSHSSLAGGIINSLGSSITGELSGIRLDDSSSLTGGITNNGWISGVTNAGIRVKGDSNVSGGITNSGTISGSGYSVYVTNEPALDAIVVTGNNTAKFIGDVFARQALMSVANGATYTPNDGNKFTVSGFNNAGILKMRAGEIATITGATTGEFTNTGTFTPIVASMSSRGQLSVSGNATLGGTMAVDAASATGLAVGTIAGVITATAVTGTFATVTDNSTLFDFTAAYTSTTVDLVLAAAAAGGSGNSTVLSSVTKQGNTPALGAARVLDQIIASNPTGPLAQQFVQFTTEQQVSDAVSQSLPLLVGGSQVAGSAALTGMNRVIQARIESNRGLSSGDGAMGDRKMWLKPFGSWAEQDDQGAVSGYDAKTTGLAIGLDSVVGDRLRLGASFAYANAHVDGNSHIAPNSADVDVYQLIGYGSYNLDAATDINFQVGLGRNNNEGKRHLPSWSLTAKSDYSSDVYTIGAGIGRVHTLSERTTFTPSIRADYTQIKDESYHESGAGVFNLDVKSRKAEELIVAVDGKFNHALESGSIFTANLGVGYDTMNEGTSITASYAGAPGAAFTTEGLDVEPWLVRGGLGISSTMANGVELSARYDVEYRENFLNQTASVKARWAF